MPKYTPDMANWVSVGKTADVAAGTSKMVEVEGQEIAVYNCDGKYYATSNICPHQGGPLHEGMIEGTTVICPWHAWGFDVTTGAGTLNPRAKIPCYAVKTEGEDLLVSLGD